ncbi:MAG TPA: twitching motility protein PilT [Streptosporangiaceae bacterium]|nr:twitching motility protein PilT [Streptosporangiaceae bacterium]
MSALILDAGALVAVDRDDREMMARLRASQQHGLELRTNAMVVAQVWRDRHGRQVNLARLLLAVDVRPISHSGGRDAGVLLADAGTADPIDATVVLLAAPGDRILTSDPDDLTRLSAAALNRAVIVTC